MTPNSDCAQQLILFKNIYIMTTLQHKGDEMNAQQQLFMEGKGTMDVWTADGEPVAFGNKNGYDWQREAAAKVLEEGMTYIVKSVDVGSWTSTVELVEFPGQHFNTVMFYNVTEEYRKRDWWGDARDALYRALEEM